MNISQVISKFTSVSETQEALRIHHISLNIRSFKFISNLNQVLNNYKIGEISISDEFDDEIDLNDSFPDTISNSDLVLKVSKYRNDKRIVFFTLDAFSKYISDSSTIHDEIILIFSEKSYTALSTNYLSRKYLWENPNPIKKGIINSIRNVKPLNERASKFLPEDIGSLIFIDSADLPNIYHSWLNTSALKCLASLSSEFIIEEETIKITFNGLRKSDYEIHIPSFSISKDEFSNLQNICMWIFNEGNDIELKHSLFNNQVALIDSTNNSINVILEKSLVNSKLAYKFHLSKVSKELHKSLSDLNKNLIDNLQKARQNATELMNSLWKDFTTVFALLIINFSIKKPDIDPKYWDFAFLVIILYLAISLSLNASTGFWFLKRIRMSLEDLKTSVYIYLTDKDFNQFALDPIIAAQKRYRVLFFIILAAYIAIAFGLIYLFFWDRIAEFFSRILSPVSIDTQNLEK